MIVADINEWESCLSEVLNNMSRDTHNVAGSVATNDTGGLWHACAGPVSTNKIHHAMQSCAGI